MNARRPLFAWVRSMSTWAALISVTTTSASADITILAITGDALPGGGELLQGVSPGAINDSGHVVFRSTLQDGVAGVDATNNEALLGFEGTSSELMARKGAPAPGGGTFDALQRATLDNTGSVALRAKLLSGQTGIWRLSSPGAGTVVARTDDFPVPGVPDAQFQALNFPLLQSPNNVIAVGATMASGPGGVGPTNNRGAWLDDGSDASLLARAGITATPGVPAGRFEGFGVTAVNDAGQASIRASLQTGFGGVTSTTKNGIWRFGAGGDILVAREAVGGVPGVAGALFDQFEDPVINIAGQIAFDATLVGGARGVWRYDGSAGVLLARTGADVAPGTAGAQFSNFSIPLLNDAGQTLFKGTLAAGIGGVGGGNNLGLWLVEPGDGALLARSGSGGVPGVPGANFVAFGATALNAVGTAAVTAELEIGPGGVAPGNEHGIWLLDAAGGSRLIARTGDALAERTIASLELAGGSGGGDGLARSLNNNGQLVFKVAFTDGAEALVLYSPETPESPADFDGDGDVDGNDLSRWATNFGAGPGATNGQGDADLDGDVDGADFLAWQREVTPTASSASVPEPASGLLSLATALVAVRRRRPHCLEAAAALSWK